MRRVMTLLAVGLLLSACQTAPQPTESVVSAGEIKPGNTLKVQTFDYGLKSASSGNIDSMRKIAEQAAASQGFELRFADKTSPEVLSGDTKGIAISLQEREYALELEQWNSVVLTLRLDEPQIRVMVTDDTHLSLKSAGYAFDRLRQLFKLLRAELAKAEGQR